MSTDYSENQARQLFLFLLEHRRHEVLGFELDRDIVGAFLKVALSTGRKASEVIEGAVGGTRNGTMAEKVFVSDVLLAIALYGFRETVVEVSACANAGLRAAAEDALLRYERFKSRGIEPIAPGPLSGRERAMASLVLREQVAPDELESLVALLGGEQKSMRARAKVVLAGLGADSRDALFDLLEKRAVTKTAEFIELLGLLKDPRGVRHLAAAFRDIERRYDHRFRETAFNALGQIEGEETIEFLISLLIADGAFREVPRALLEIGEPAAAPLKRAYEEHVVLRRHEGELLARVVGEGAVGVLVKRLKDPDEEVRDETERALKILGKVAVPQVLPLTRDENGETRRRAVRVLGSVGDMRAFERVIELVFSGTPEDRAAAIEALGGFPFEHAGPNLRGLLRSARSEVRVGAARALGRYEGSKEALKLLTEAGRDKDKQVRLQAIESIRVAASSLTSEEDLVPVVRALLRMLTDKSEAVAAESLRALSHLARNDFAQAIIIRLIKEAIPASKGVKKRKLSDALKFIILEWTRRERRGGLAAFVDSAASDYSDSDYSEPMRSLEHSFEAYWPDDILLFEPTAQRPISEETHFSITAPPAVRAGTFFLLDVWAHLEADRDEVMRRAQSALREKDIYLRSVGPFLVERETLLQVRLSIPDFGGATQEDAILWSGKIGNCTFPVQVPREAAAGKHLGTVYILAAGLQVAKLHFDVEVGEENAPAGSLPTRESRIRSAFASYASKERGLVLGRIQGMLKIVPYLDIFLDAASLRSGERWEDRLMEEINRRDVFYLFWSLAASRSRWVRKEWRAALQAKGLDFINPVPLEKPEKAPRPPAELAELHFDEWTLHFS
ncbi:MAG TPA: HEAT repeat domain-containing protein [Pyrinomonadaceae bacterium]|nr:HEAT repeat domain-containing protein [Pyrinomonadaceae bacterium]